MIDDSYTPVQILSVKLITPCKNVLVKCKGCQRFVDLSETAVCLRCGRLVEVSRDDTDREGYEDAGRMS